MWFLFIRGSILCHFLALAYVLLGRFLLLAVGIFVYEAVALVLSVAVPVQFLGLNALLCKLVFALHYKDGEVLAHLCVAGQRACPGHSASAWSRGKGP